MREFFRGWRRKVGVVTLVMAYGLCLDLCASYGRIHQGQFIPYVRSHTWLETNQGQVEAWHFDADRDGIANTLAWRLPYVVVVMPLTLLSAYLILWPGK